jgi:hypothetical protein
MKDRRIKQSPRGAVDWYEAYERRKHPYTYKERSSSMVRTIMCIIFTIALFVLFWWSYMLLCIPNVKTVEQIKEAPAIDMGIWSEDNQGNSLAGKGDSVENYKGN